MDEDLTPRKRTSRGRKGAAPWNVRLALVVFAIMVTGGLLAFGAVDRAVQIPLTVLLAVGLLLTPPKVMPLPPWINRLVVALVMILILKELLPASWFGVPAWRSMIHESFGVTLPSTHHPEPGRALDGWLAGALGLLWFSWVRMLALERDDRIKLAWGLFLAALVVALASFGLSKISKDSIFGLRYTPEWFGFGPFPNRNHTATLLAMGAVIGLGCVAHAGARKRFDWLCTGAFAIAVIMAALLKTQSRGGLLALGIGIAVFLVAIVAKAQSKKALSVALAIALLMGGFALVAGGKTLGRFTSSERLSDESSVARLAIWRDTLTMWRDAPLLGYGVGAFQGVFPFYQDLAVEDVTVKHPESSMLQWLVELGLIPVVVSSAIGIVFLLPHVRSAFERRSSFYLAAGGFGAVAVLLTHSFVDVPGHRWGTAGFALAALAMACPASRDAPEGSRRAAIVPLGIAAFWTLPLWLNGPAWSPFQLDRILSAGAMQPQVYDAQIQASLRWFPLSPKLHLLRAQTLELRGAPSALWQNEYRIAARLVPSSWTICAQIAKRCRRSSPSVALHYWQMAVERASLHRIEAFKQALNETGGLPAAETAWQSYIEVNPDLALAYSETRPGESGKTYYEYWWEHRGSTQVKLSDGEADAFLLLAERWGNPEQISVWTKLHGDRQHTDFRRVVALLHSWNADGEAWRIASLEVPEPEYPATPPNRSVTQLEETWSTNPGDVVNARNYAQALEGKGAVDDAGAVIVKAAQDHNAPKWFLEKAAYYLARQKRYREAVEMALRVPAS